MKLIFLLVCGLGLLTSVAEKSYAQSTKLTFALKNASIKDVLGHIEKNSEFSFMYENTIIDVDAKVDITANDETIDVILNRLLGNNTEYRVIGRHIVLFASGPRAGETLAALSQQPAVSGTVTDESGQPLPGVTVVVKGTTQGTVTNADGEYSITNIPEDATLVFSFVGMRTYEVEVGDETTINVTMEQETMGVEEVVVIGYGTQKKVNLTGAVDVVQGDRLENKPIANVGEGLQGVIPNLNITIRNGDPDSSPEFNIRGFTSINGGSPLVLVDNVPMDINRINPNDIESISVLKDAGSAAIYGARAAFGVILVTTKKGKQGKISITVNSQMSLAEPILKVEPEQDPYKYVTAWNQASIRTNGTPGTNDETVAAVKNWVDNPTDENAWAVEDGSIKFYGNNDYKNKLINDFAPAQQHNISLTGGAENISYYTSIGMFTKDGYLRDNNSRYKRYNILLKANYEVNDWLSLNQQIILNSQQNDAPTEYNWGTGINSIARIGTRQPIQFPDLPYYIEPGDREKYEPFIGMYFGGNNMFPYLLNGGRTTSKKNDVWLTTGATVNPVKGLKLVSNFSYQFFNSNFQKVHSKIDIVSTNLLGSNPIDHEFSSPDYIVNQTQSTQSYVFNAYGEYSVNFSDSHNINAVLGFNQEWMHNQSLDGLAYSLITPSVPNIHATTGLQQVDGGASHVSLRGVFYRATYNFKEKYLLEVNGRYDGSSRFPKDGRFGFFPSFSAGWRISEEKFMSNAEEWLDNLKIRASSGTLGNQLLGTNYYPYISTMNTGFPNTFPLILSSATPSVNIMWPNLVSPMLTWEKVVSKNFGLDLMILNSKLDMSFDIYTRDTKDMLMNKVYPDILGSAAPKENAADLRTRGWELSLGWQDKISTDLNYNLVFSLSDWTSEITKYENPGGNIYDYYVGKQIGEIWGFETVGIFQEQADVDNAADQSQIGSNWLPGDIQFADLDGDEKITRGSTTLEDHGDLKIIGNSNPRYQFGFKLGLDYKNWAFESFFQGMTKRDIWPSTNSWTWFYPFNSSYLESSHFENSWSEDNRDAYFPAPAIMTDDKKNYPVQTRFLQPGGYIRLKNIMLSYNLPQSLLGKIDVSNIRIYFTGFNLWEFSKIRRPLDAESIPEVTAGTPGGIEFPMQRLYTLGVNISF